MKNINIKRHKSNGLLLMVSVCCLMLASACRKITYNQIDSPAYLRVFNSLNYDNNLSTKDLPPPFLAMVIDPKYDANGLITGGDLLGDFLDKRATYAPPYPDKAGNTDYKNTEYPGSAKVLVGPVLNGIDLSSWAQIKSGKHRIVFYSRPVNSIPFFSLDDSYRQNRLVDSTINITPGEIYTMEILQRSVNQVGTLATDLYIRQEQFAKKSFSDSLLYVNFYNLSAEGYADLNPGSLSSNNYLSISNKGPAIGDIMNIYYSLFTDDTPYPFVFGVRTGNTLIPGYNNAWIGTLIRSHASGVAPYTAIPMFAGRDTTKRILSRQFEVFSMLRPGLTPVAGQIPVGIDATLGMGSANVNFGAIGCGNVSSDGKGVLGAGVAIPKATGVLPKYLASCWLPNLIKYTASGSYAQRSFATISSIEIINNQVYLMSVQRSYPAPNN